MENVVDALARFENKSLLVVFPHPDDETVMAAGLLDQAIRMGWRVKVVCVTNGALGQIHIHGEGKSVVQIRREELQEAMKVLGVSDYEMWGYCDGRLKSESGWGRKVEELIDSYEPGLVVSYGPCGVSGHPDHLALSKKIFESMVRKKTELWWPAFDGLPRDQVVSKKVRRRHVDPELRLQLSMFGVIKKYRALTAHASQSLGRGLPVPLLVAGFMFPYEQFARAKFSKKYDFSYVEFDLGD